MVTERNTIISNRCRFSVGRMLFDESSREVADREGFSGFLPVLRRVAAVLDLQAEPLRPCPGLVQRQFPSKLPEPYPPISPVPGVLPDETTIAGRCHHEGESRSLGVPKVDGAGRVRGRPLYKALRQLDALRFPRLGFL